MTQRSRVIPKIEENGKTSGASQLTLSTEVTGYMFRDNQSIIRLLYENK